MFREDYQLKIRKYLVVFCMLIFAISMIFISSCVDGKSGKKSDKTESKNVESSAENTPSKKPDVNPNIPKGIAYKNLLNGEDMYFEDFKGYVLLVDFWATWCPPCRMEIPWFIEFHNKYKDKKFEVIGVSVDKTGADKVKEFMDKIGINYPVIMATQEILKKYEDAMGKPIRSIPTTFIKNKAGEIAHTHIGVPQAANPKDVFEEEIKKLLDEK